MNTFIISPGGQAGRIANALSDFIRAILPENKVHTFGPAAPLGIPWQRELLDELRRADFCIVCLTPENVHSAWLYYEVGIVSGALGQIPVAPLVIGLKPSQIVGGPLGIFQVLETTESGLWTLIQQLNNRMVPQSIEAGDLKTNFEQGLLVLKPALKAALLDFDPVSLNARLEPSQPSPATTLSSEEQKILLEIAKDPNGRLAVIRTMHGLIIQTNRKQLLDGADPRSEATWQAAIRRLVQEGLLESHGTKGEIFSLTADGYRFSDLLSLQAGTPERV